MEDGRLHAEQVGGGHHRIGGCDPTLSSDENRRIEALAGELVESEKVPLDEARKLRSVARRAHVRIVPPAHAALGGRWSQDARLTRPHIQPRRRP